MKTRTDLLNHLASRYNLTRYLEIGVQDASQNFDKINCRLKHGVDPDIESGATHLMTSDEFFEYNKDHSQPDKPVFCYYDLIFIDGLHTADQAKKDFENALKCLSRKGFIVIHDCNPEKEEHTIVPRPKPTGHWNGDVWRFAVHFYGYGMTNYTVDIDNGCKVIYPNGAIFKTGISEMPWSEFNKNKKKYLHLISWEEFINLP